MIAPPRKPITPTIAARCIACLRNFSLMESRPSTMKATPKNAGINAVGDFSTATEYEYAPYALRIRPTKTVVDHIGGMAHLLRWSQRRGYPRSRKRLDPLDRSAIVQVPR